MAEIKELREFDRMTRPVKFRRLKMIGQWLHRDVIKYKVYNILYKLHLLKRYSYRTEDEVNFHAPDFKPRTVETSNFLATVLCKLSELVFIEQDYFYTEKRGVKKIRYVIKDETRKTKMLTCYLDTVCLKIGDRVYMPEHLPVIKVSVIENFKNSQIDGVTPIPQFTQVTYDVSKIEKLRSRVILNTFNPDEVSYTYTNQCLEFMRAMDKFTLKDLEVN